ncbi:MAG: S6e family ribosomal protein [Nanoarchaeota archaeon]
MPVKINIAENGLTYRIEMETPPLIGKSVGDKIDGRDVKQELEHYELEIAGGSDFSGFPMSQSLEGLGLKKMLFSKGWGMHDKRKGVRLRKTVRGKIVSEKTAQLNLKVIKAGKTPLAQIFPDQNKPKESGEQIAQKAVA